MRPGRKEKLSSKDVGWLRANWGLPMRDLATACQVDMATVFRYARKYDFGPHAHHRYQDRTVEPRPVPTLWRCYVCQGRCQGQPIHPCHEEAA